MGMATFSRVWCTSAVIVNFVLSTALGERIVRRLVGVQNVGNKKRGDLWRTQRKRSAHLTGRKARRLYPRQKSGRLCLRSCKARPFAPASRFRSCFNSLSLRLWQARAETLKERIIGASVFDRRPDYDTNADPIVRLRVAEVRKRLALYYQTASEEPVLISIPSGSFQGCLRVVSARIRFQCRRIRCAEQNQLSRRLSRLIPPVQTGVAAPDLKPSSARFRLRRWWIVLAASLAIVILATLRYLPSPDERAFNKFWSPVLENSNTVLIGMGNNPLYELSNAGEDEYYKNHPKNSISGDGTPSLYPANSWDSD